MVAKLKINRNLNSAAPYLYLYLKCNPKKININKIGINAGNNTKDCSTSPRNKQIRLR
jgi:hypothetical protein